MFRSSHSASPGPDRPCTNSTDTHTKFHQSTQSSFIEDQDHSHQIRKRPIRASRACDNCRRRKVKCSEGTVCAECRRFGEECVYREFYRPRKEKKSPTSRIAGHDSVRGFSQVLFNSTPTYTGNHRATTLPSVASPIPSVSSFPARIPPSSSTSTSADVIEPYRSSPAPGTPGGFVATRYPVDYYASPRPAFPNSVPNQPYISSSFAGPPAAPPSTAPPSAAPPSIAPPSIAPPSTAPPLVPIPVSVPAPGPAPALSHHQPALPPTTLPAPAVLSEQRRISPPITTVPPIIQPGSRGQILPPPTNLPSLGFTKGQQQPQPQPHPQPHPPGANDAHHLALLSDASAALTKQVNQKFTGGDKSPISDTMSAGMRTPQSFQTLSHKDSAQLRCSSNPSSLPTTAIDNSSVSTNNKPNKCTGGSGDSSPSVHVSTPVTPPAELSSLPSKATTSSGPASEMLMEEKMLQAMAGYGDLFDYFAVGLDFEILSKKAKRMWRTSTSSDIPGDSGDSSDKSSASADEILERGIIYSIISLGCRANVQNRQWTQLYADKASESLQTALSSPPSTNCLIFLFHQALIYIVDGNFTAAFTYAGIIAKMALLLAGVNLLSCQELSSNQGRMLRFARALEQYTSIRAGQQSVFASDLDKLFEKPGFRAFSSSLSSPSSSSSSCSRSLNNSWLVNYNVADTVDPAIGHSVMNQQLIALCSHALRSVRTQTWDLALAAQTVSSPSESMGGLGIKDTGFSNLPRSSPLSSPTSLLVQSYTMCFETSRDMVALLRNPQDYGIPAKTKSPENSVVSRALHLHLCSMMFRPFLLVLWGVENGQYCPPPDVKEAIMNGTFRCIQNALELINIMMECDLPAVKRKRVFYFETAVSVLVVYTLFYNKQNAEGLRLDIKSITAGLDKAEKYLEKRDKLQCANPFLQFAMPISSESTLLSQWHKVLHVVA